MDSCFGATTNLCMHVTATLFGCRVKHIRVPRIKNYIVNSGVVADVEHLIPGLATIGCLVQATFTTGSPN